MSENTNIRQVKNLIEHELLPFAKQLSSVMHSHKKEAKIRLSEQEIPLCLATLQTNESVIFLSALPLKKTYALFHTIKSWQNLLGQTRSWHILTGSLTPQELNGEIITDASQSVHALLNTGSQLGFIVQIDALQSPLPEKKIYHDHFIHVVPGETISIKKITEALSAAGYVRHSSGLEPGGFRVTGEKIDVSHPFQQATVSITWYGPRIERLISTAGRRQQQITSLNLPPLKLPPATMSWSSLTKDLVVISPAMSPALSGKMNIITDSLQPDISFPFVTARVNRSDIKPAVIFYENYDRTKTQAQHIYPSATLITQPLANQAFVLESQNSILTTEKALLPEPVKTSHSPIGYERARELMSALTPGRPAVHADHGIGIYEGLQSRVIDGVAKEYMVLRYAAGDALSVPVEFAHKVTPYIGEGHPVVHRLGGTLWQKTRRKAQHDAIAFAQELLAISRVRHQKTRTAYSLDADIEDQLANTFDYTLTPDQEQTWQEVKQDLGQDTPMDRLIVGDVGFGKTEIALRAAYHAIQSGRQVALLAPTTLLVQQHTDTFRSRLAKEQFRIGELSRFISTKDQKQTKEKIANGELSIAIGTHALLSKSVTWKNLGLVIIDEEQRFGVRHKEHFKKIRGEVDVLSLSATPIPRTLSMALSGLRQLSIIATPPAGRKDIVTYVGKTNDTVIKEAINRELKRGGQVYIVAPKIRQLSMIKEHIQALIPTAKIAVAHGQMDEKALAAVIHGFDEGQTNILVSSSIVEHGLDLPATNTIIVWQALFFGLADLYQLRGRIGRRSTQGYAYFLYDQAELTSVQRQRLTALTESQRLGSGWLIAQRDLEIRGAGNILGAEQHGSVSAVGAQLYLDLINEAVEEHDLFTKQVTIELPLPAVIPSHYIADMGERTRWYQRLTRSRTIQQLETLSQTLQNNYGQLPEEVRNLILLIKLQRCTAAAGITFVGTKTIAPPDEDPYMRLEIQGENLPQVMQSLTILGNWRIRGDKATWDTEKITAQTVEKVVQALQSREDE